MANADITSEDTDGAEGGAQGDGRRKLSKKVLIAGGAGAIVLLLGGGAGAAYMLGWIGSASPERLALEQAQVPKFYYDLPEITVNLSNQEQRAQYLRLVVALELPSQDIALVIEPNLPRILDVFQTYLRELRISDLEGSAGLFRLKHELQRRINLAIFPAEIDAVLFREIIVQ